MKLYVGNLPYNTTEDDLRTLFSQYGGVTSVAIITDRLKRSAENGTVNVLANVSMRMNVVARRASRNASRLLGDQKATRMTPKYRLFRE